MLFSYFRSLIAGGLCLGALSTNALAVNPMVAAEGAASQVTQNITIDKISQTISFGPAPTIVVGGTGTVSATATSGLPVISCPP